jgi:hypothetical protein
MNILLVILIFILLASCAGLALSLYLFFKKDSNLVIVDRNKYTLKKKDLNKNYLFLDNNHRIVIPSSSKKWKGIITLTNIQNVTDTLDIKTESRIKLIRYTGNVPSEGEITPNNVTHNILNNVKGTIELTNYRAEIFFTGDIVNIEIHTLFDTGDINLS